MRRRNSKPAAVRPVTTAAPAGGHSPAIVHRRNAEAMVRTAAAFVCIALWAAAAVQAQAVRSRPPEIELFHPLSEEPVPPSILFQERPALLENKSTLFEDREVIDFEKREVSFERAEKNYNIVVWQYRYDELDSYLESRRRAILLSLWYKSALTALATSAEKKKNLLAALAWELPVQYPSWAQRILGKDPPRLSISGYEKIIVSYETGKTDLQASNVQTRPNNGLVFDQENQFSITGSVGRLINLNIKGTTKQVDQVENPLKNFKIEYKGEGDELEDEIVQQVSAGATSFEMPSTQLSGYSGGHQGLFGLNVKSKLGPLALTGVASIEEGESQKATLYPSGQGESSTQISEKDFIRNKKFFLDTVYLNRYLGDSTGTPVVESLQVWLSNDKIRQQASASNTSNSTSDIYRFIGSSRQAFKYLRQNHEYYLDPKEGSIRFDSITIDNALDDIGIYLQTSGPRVIKKGFNALNSTSATDTLWILKLHDFDSTNATFPLMWRNIYMLPQGFDASKFRLRVTKALPDTNIDKVNNTYFSEILGLTDDKGNPYSNTQQIFDNINNLIILPVQFKGKNGTRGNEPFSNDALGPDNANHDIYRKTGVDFDNVTKKFLITMSGSSRKTTFTLGFGSVMEGTEVLRVGSTSGPRLERGKDYIIDYQLGQVDLISKNAQSADKIEVEYQSESQFTPNQKVFLGARGEMKLPFFSDKSFIGASVLWQDASSRDAVPKINQEPYSKLLLDMNMAIDVEPEWMTKAVNLLPLVSTAAKSTVTFEAEVAHSITNPNTDGQAYIDDFESSKETYPMGLSQATWYQASPPTPWVTYNDSAATNDSLLHHPPAWIQYWYAPLGDAQELKTNIFDSCTDCNNQTQADKYEPTLNWVAQMAPPDTNPYRSRYDSTANPWAGIMTYFPSGTTNREKDKYLEFWARDTGGGRMYIDLGTVSEAVSLDGGPPYDSLMLEDKHNTGVLCDSLNIGLDHRVDKDEFYCVPNAAKTGWDTLWCYMRDTAATMAAGHNVWLTDAKGHEINDPWLAYPSGTPGIPGDPSKDNYKSYDITIKGDEGNYRFVNGTERDGYLNTEDLNGDGFQRVNDENYFRRFIDFGKQNDSVFLRSNANNYQVSDSVANESKRLPEPRWHLYRVPLNDTITGICQRFGSPKWNDIKYIRIWWTNIGNAKRSKENTIQFARIQFVGNQWLEVPAVHADSSHEVKLAVSTVNTEDNAKSYGHDLPPGVYRLTDAQGNLARESSLDLVYKNINAGDTALVERSMAFQPLNLSSYDNLSVLVHNDTTGRTGFWYFLRFGTDDSTYYESRMQLSVKGWRQMNISLREISDMKLSFQRELSDTVALDASVQSGTNIFTVRSPKGRSPSFANITYMAMGVMRDSSATGPPLNGELWIDEMKVSGIKPLSGWAARLQLTTKWADFMNLSLGVDYQDGSFRRMTDNQTGLANSQLSMNFSVDWDVDKFLPERWGVNIPLGTRFTGSLMRPQIKPGSDIYLNLPNGGSDGLLEMYQDALNMLLGTNFQGPSTDSRHFQTRTFQRDWWTGYAKKSQSKNPFINMTLDRTAVDLSASFKTVQTGQGQRKESEGGADVLDQEFLDSYHGILKYNLNPTLEPRFYKFKPFEQSKLLWLPERIKNYEFSYLPTTLTFDVAEVTYSKDITIKGLTYDTTVAKRLELDHRMNLVYDPINILNFSYNLSTSRNLDNDVSRLDLQKSWWSFLTNNIAQMDTAWGHYGVLYGERARTQGMTLRFDPSFLDWLSHSFDYSANYKQNANFMTNDPTPYQNLTSDATFHLSSTLTLASLFKNFADGFANYKAMAKVFKSIEDALNKIAFNSVKFDYSAKSSLLNDDYDVGLLRSRGITQGKFLGYQFGLSGRNAWDVVTGNMDDNAFGGMNFRRTAANLEQYDTRTSSMNYSLSTSFNLPDPIDIQFTDIRLGWSRQYLVRPDTTAKDTTFTFPDFSVSMKSGLLGKIPLLAQQVQGLQISSSCNYQKKLRVNGTASNMNWTTTDALKFSPVVGVDGTLKRWPVNANASWTWGRSTETNRMNQNAAASDANNSYKETMDNDYKLGIKYEVSKSGGVNELKILMWTIPMKGRLVTGLDADYGTDVTKTATGGAEPTESANSTVMSLSPHASYDFTDNITGQLSYTGSQKKDLSQTTTSHIFSLTVEIRFNP
ncbi:MAG TPA: cell surface protein SprA [Chitinivibrionales bacterium]|nr:cell surface protein SprA [Chitinivibrionales bacterium]